MPSPHPPDPSDSVNDRQSSAHRPESSAWGSNSSFTLGTRRGLTPLSTAVQQSTSRPPSSAQSPRAPWSPTNPSISSIAASGTRQGTRSSSISSATSPFPPPQSAGPPTSQSGSSRSRPLTSSANPPVASAGGSIYGSLGGGGSSRLSRGSPSVSQSSYTSPTTSSGAGAAGAGQSGSLSKITIAQVFLLLSTLKEDKDKSKWESQVDQIRKLVDSNGMEVFTKYFRRLLLTNAPQVWSSGRATDTSGSYQILVTEMHKVSRDPLQPLKIAEAIEFGDGDIFKDFDLSIFMEHFKLSAMAKVTLASAFKRATKSDLRTKADAILSNNLQTFLSALAKPSSSSTSDLTDRDFPSEVVAGIIDRLAQSPPRNWTADSLSQLKVAVQQRYNSLGLAVPLDVGSALYIFTLLSPQNTLVRLVQRHGPKATENVEICRNMLESIDAQEISPDQVASALLYMAMSRDEPSYNPSAFVAAVREHRGGQRLDWQDVIQEMDRDGVKITKKQFKSLFDSSMVLAKAYENFDIQMLWGGEWRHEETQLAFVSAFLSFTEDELDASQIPRLRKAYTLEDFQDASPEVRAYAESAVRHPLVSLDATRALFNMVFRSSDTYAHAQAMGVIEEVINPKMDLFVCSVSAVPKPWGPLQDQAMKQLIGGFFLKQLPTHAFVFHVLWKRDGDWLANRLLQIYQQNNLHLHLIYEHAEEHGWLQDLVGRATELSLDLAALAHGRGQFDLEAWLQDIAQQMPAPRLLAALNSFLRSRAEDDVQVHKEGADPVHVPMTVRTVYALLQFLGEAGLHEDGQVSLQRTCISAYPRLINYGEGYDEIIDANGRSGNAISPDADSKMQEHYKHMYSGEKTVTQIVEALQRYKSSEDPGEQDLFACMIFGLFDEYNCFGQYPLDALATTAVLFGGIINYNLLSRIALKAALAMVLEAVSEFAPNDSMYKFGLQALLHFSDRLQDWKMFSERLLNVQGLQGTPIYPIAEQVVRDQIDDAAGDGKDGISHVDDPTADSVRGGQTLDEDMTPEFSCLNVDSSLHPEHYEDPDKSTEEHVLFHLNNLTELNLTNKLKSLKEKLRDEHTQWFANLLVDQRIKSQPNFQQLYMDMLEKLDDTSLWAEILRETYVSIFRLLNAEATLNSSADRNLLKNLAGWLGALTLARNKPIKFRNISFRDLLVEANSTQRLPIAIPFTCNVLNAAAKSVVFQPPCAWTMEICQILAELYDYAGLKVQLKFAIEILFTALGLSLDDIERSDAIRSRPHADEELMSTMTDVNVDGFNDLSIMNFGRRALAERLSPASMVPELSDLSSVLKHNYSLPPTTVSMQSKIRQALTTAAERAVAEIVGPVVERSVTIAAISATQLVSKDFILERDEIKFQSAAHTTVRSLAASLALVTCKEPLRQAMAANVRAMGRDVPQEALPEGSVLMFVNDNLETVCSIIEKAAENASVTEIDAQIDEALRARRDGTYNEGPLNRWSYFIPDPYKLLSGGLNREQLAIYEDFSRLARGSASHSNNLSQDSVRQLPDVLQDQYASLPNMPTPGEMPPLPRQGNQQAHSHIMPSQAPNQQHLVNGYGEGQAQGERIPELIANMIRAGQDAIDEGQLSESVLTQLLAPAWLQLQGEIRRAGPGPAQLDISAWAATAELYRVIVQGDLQPPVVNFLALVLGAVVRMSENTAQAFYQQLQTEPERLSNAVTACAFVKGDLIDVKRVDLMCAKGLQEEQHQAFEYLNQVIDILLFDPNDPPKALRSDFTHTISQLSMNPDNQAAQSILHKLSDSPNLDLSLDPTAAKNIQHRYIFDEWCHLLENDASEPSVTTFVHQMHAKSILSNTEDTTLFFWTCIDRALDRTVEEASSAMFRVDALAKLMVCVVLNQAPANGSVKSNKASYFHGLLTTVVLVLAHHYRHRGDVFDQKSFFRLFSSILCEMQAASQRLAHHYDSMVLTFGRVIGLLQPQQFPGFAFAWITLVSHRMLMPALIRSQEEAGSQIFVDLLATLFGYVGDLLKPYDVPPPGRDLFRGTMKLLLVLHHDFPQFLVDHHYQLINPLPVHCTQMRNLIVSALPSTAPISQPDPFTDGLQVDRLEENKRIPVIAGDVTSPLIEAGVKEAVDDLLNDRGDDDDALLEHLVSAITNPPKPITGIGFVPVAVDSTLLNAIVLYGVMDAEAAVQPRSLVFSASSPHARLLEGLMDKLPAGARYYFINAIVNQLRYPNSHTYFFSYAINHLFRAGQVDSASTKIQEQIARVLLERLVASRPHPWGLIVTMLELLKNRNYNFWDLPFVKGTPEPALPTDGTSPTSASMNGSVTRRHSIDSWIGRCCIAMGAGFGQSSTGHLQKRRRLGLQIPHHSVLYLETYYWDEVYSHFFSDNVLLQVPRKLDHHLEMPSEEHARSRSPREHTSRHERQHRSRSPRRKHNHHRRHHHHHHAHHHSTNASPPPHGLPDTTSVPLPPRPFTLPLRAVALSRHDLPSYRNMFASYLDIQKQLDVDDMDERELKGRWKSFMSKWNRGELAEGWYDPATKSRADEAAASMPARAALPDYSDTTRHTPSQLPSAADAGSADDSDDYGPPPPPSGLHDPARAGPTRATFADLAYRDDLSSEQREAHAAALRAARKADKKQQRERQDELAPRAAAGTRERQLERRADAAASNRAFAASREGDVAEVQDGELLGGGGADDLRRLRREEERRKSDKEIRREEQLRARAAEREERVRGMREKEDRTMEMFKGLVKERYGGGGS
ncbi:hypothetical protein FH972_021663 [Carpinus fangiana]|uniref:Uncharacterized protein n=1 Tax=Carpinus fangiana TaxID=176857 RepID=A0A5N6KQC2_9ROSI|nr:hypothetical protein FH972_021663 [Carpinus fangiana]